MFNVYQPSVYSVFIAIVLLHWHIKGSHILWRRKNELAETIMKWKYCPALAPQADRHQEKDVEPSQSIWTVFLLKSPSLGVLWSEYSNRC